MLQPPNGRYALMEIIIKVNYMAKNLFEIIPADFYKPLTSKYRRMYADTILLIFNTFKQEISYGVNRETIVKVSTNTLNDIVGTKIYGKRIITVENLTSFHGKSFKDGDVCIYLGGYHNKVKREFLKMIYDSNKTQDYYHFGDIDAGGFYIYEHLRRQTGISFKTMKMNREMLDKYKNYTKKLTVNDKQRIRALYDKYKTGEIVNQESEEIKETLKYMLDNEIKLEQEAID